MPLEIVATCALGLEPLLADELQGLGMHAVEARAGAVGFRGDWRAVWRANWRLRTANRVLVQLARWPAADADALTRGAEALVTRRGRAWDGVTAGALFQPHRTLALRAASSGSRLTDVRWIALRVKDGLVDGQRRRYGRRASVDRQNPDLPLRVWLHRDQAALLLDTSGVPLDRRGYRAVRTQAPVREQLAAACVLAAGWDGRGPVVDPMCGSGTLLIEAGWIARGTAPGHLRTAWAFERLPGFDAEAFRGIRAEALPAPGPDVPLLGIDRDPQALAAARTNLARAGLMAQARLVHAFAGQATPPPGPGLLVVNPAYGQRLGSDRDQWRRLGDLLKQHYAGWKAVVLAGDEGRGKWIGLRPERRLSVKNGPLDARILVFSLYARRGSGPGQRTGDDAARGAGDGAREPRPQAREAPRPEGEPSPWGRRR